MGKQSNLVYLDSCVIIDCLEKTPVRYQHLEPIIKEAESQRLQVIASVLCKAEVLRVQNMPDSDADELINAFFEQEYVHLYAVDNRIAERAASIRKNFPLETADAVHVATAIQMNVGTFITRDGEGRSGKGRKKTILELRHSLGRQIDILSPIEFFGSLSSDVKQIHIAIPEETGPQDEADGADDEETN
jgi:predicted nucleic acid-binding protein